MLSWKNTSLCKRFFFLLFSFTLLFSILHLKILRHSVYEENENQIEGTVETFQIDGNELSFTLKAKEKVKVFYYFQTEEEKMWWQDQIGYGDFLVVDGTLERPSENRLPNTFNPKEYYYVHHIFYIMKGSKLTKIKNGTFLDQIKTTITKEIGKRPDASYFKAFLLGDTSSLDKKTLRENGILHLFAVSGMHFAFFIFFLENILQRFSKRKFLITAFLLFYSYLCNFTPSVMRAFLFYIGKNGNEYFHRPLSSKQLFGLIFCLFLLYDPCYLKNIGFQYSFFISYSYLFQENESKNIWKTSLISFLASLPITANTSFQCNFLTILWNVFFIPFVTYLFYPMTFLTFFFPFLTPFYHFVGLFFLKCNDFCHTFSFGNLVLPKSPGWMWILYLFFFLLYLKRKKISSFLGCVFVILLIILYPYGKLSTSIYYLDVGQGDAALYVSPRLDDTVLIDTGGKVSYFTEEWMKKQNPSSSVDDFVTFFHSLGITKIDTLILSHGDVDHAGNASSLIEEFPVSQVIFNVGDFNLLETQLQKLLQEKKIFYTSGVYTLQVGNNPFYFLHTFDYHEENNNSNVVYFRVNHYQFLFMGDASSQKEMDLLQKYPLENIDFLKVGHHGSDTSTSEIFIKQIKPKYAVISVGAKNLYGHPSKSVLNRLQNTFLYRTDVDQTIQVEIWQNHYQIKTHL